MTAQRRAADEDGDVAAVGIDVEIVRIEVGDADPHAAVLPVRACEAARDGDRAKLEHRGVGRQHAELAAAGHEGETSIERLAQVGNHLEPVSREPGVGESQRELRRPLPARDDALGLSEQRLEVDVPDPRDVPAVGDPVVEGDHERCGHAALFEGSHCLVRAGRVLDQQHQDPLVAGLDPLEPAERSCERAEPGHDLVEGRVEHEGGRRSGERVVDVVETGEGKATRAEPAGVSRSNTEASSACSSIDRAAMSSGGRA